MGRLATILALLVLAALVPVTAFAQGSIAGIVTDSVRRRAARRHGRSRQPGADRKGPLGRRPTGPGQYQIVNLPPGALHRDVHAAGLQHAQARRHRADRQLHRDGQRRPSRRRARGNDHGHRRGADRGRPEHRPAADRRPRHRSRTFRPDATSGRSARSIPASPRTCRRTSAAPSSTPRPACRRTAAAATTAGRRWRASR